MTLGRNFFHFFVSFVFLRNVWIINTVISPQKRGAMRVGDSVPLDSTH